MLVVLSRQRAGLLVPLELAVRLTLLVVSAELPLVLVVLQL
jgi:hypothetical protein